MHKRKGFECEREVRVLSYNKQHYGALAWALTGGDGFTPAPDPAAELPEHIFLEWRPLEIADAITISPDATADYEQRVRDAVSSIDPSAVGRIELSVLSERRYAANF